MENKKSVKQKNISKENMIGSCKMEIDFECPICMEPIDTENVIECLNCEIRICRNS